MNQDLINLTKKSVENCKANGEALQSRINRLEMEVRDAERELFKVDNVKQSLEAALERLEEADEKEKTGQKLEEEKKAEENQLTSETVEVSHPVEIPEESILTDEEKDQATLEKANKLIKREKEKEKKDKGWELCTECNFHHVAPWNKKGICSPCQLKRKTKR